MSDLDFAYLILSLGAFGGFAAVLAFYMMRVPSRD